MAIPDLVPINGVWNDVTPAAIGSPYTPAWWMSSYVTRVPETAVGWLVAQGWQIIRTYEEDDVTYYELSRQSMQNWKILQTLLDSYVFSYNEGRRANDIRYEDLLYNWNQMLVASRTAMDTAGDVSDAHVVTYFSTIDSLLAEFETDVGIIKTELDEIGTDIDAQLALYIAKINAIEADYDTHAATVRALLVDLGTTETARINEQFDNLLAKAKQGLVSRGLYSSVLYSALETRIERERSEALVTLNDKLAREKVDNEHGLFKEYLETKEMVLGGRARYIAQLMAKSQLQDTKAKLVMSLMQARMEKANARLGVRDREAQFIMGQLDLRNNIAFRMHATCENREDSYPDMSSISKLVAGLGDAGGSWVVP